MTQRLVRVGIVALVLVLVTGCPKKKPGEAEGGAEAGADATAEMDAGATPAVVAIANEAEIARFPDETKLESVPATIQVGTSNLRKAPPSGPLVTTLPKGTAVTQIAQREKYFLVTFDNPKDATQKLMGWVYVDAFNAAPPAPVVKMSCPAGQTLVLGDGPFCGIVCDGDDKKCPTGQACRGAAQRLVNGKATDALAVCVVYRTAPIATVDAGGGKLVVAPDAGAPIVVADAGPGPGPAPAAGGPVVEPAGGKCPGGYVLVAETKKCHKTWVNVTDCPLRTYALKAADGSKVCSLSRKLAP